MSGNIINEEREKEMIDAEIVRAKTLHERFGDEMLNNHSLFGLMETYRKAIVNSHELMEEMNILNGCTECAENARAGSCCFQGIEEWYDHILLLINLMFGVAITTSHDILGGCLFVGEKGCTLLARHAFCVNYICPALKDSLTNFQREKLQFINGHELYSGWELEKSIRHWVRV